MIGRVDSPRRSAVPVVLLAGVAGVFAWLALRARSESSGPSRPVMDRPTTPIGRLGEPGPEWTVVETLPVARPAPEIALHLHEHGGLPGLTGGVDGPVMDRLEWDVEGRGHYEAEVHGLPGAATAEVTVRFSPMQGGAQGAVEAAAAALPLVGGPSVRSPVSRSLSRLQRLLESTAPGTPERESGAAEARKELTAR